MNIKLKEKGFTIIEVVLVLAIAGLIFLMVFIAVPAMNRSQRDTQRRNDLSRLETALNSYQTNNRRAIPTTQADWNDFKNHYVTTSGDTFIDPSGTEYILDVDGTIDPDAEFSGTAPKIFIKIGSKCDGETTVAGQGARKVAFQMKLEGSGVACQNN